MRKKQKFHQNIFYFHCNNICQKLPHKYFATVLKILTLQQEHRQEPDTKRKNGSCKYKQISVDLRK